MKLKNFWRRECCFEFPVIIIIIILNCFLYVKLIFYALGTVEMVTVTYVRRPETSDVAFFSRHVEGENAND